MSLPDDLAHRQIISGVSGRDGAQIVAGSVLGNVTFTSTYNPKEALEKASKECRNALFLTDPEIDRENLISTKGKRVASTCEWIKSNDQYQAWLRGDRHLLWISGGPGKGKTMLSIFLTQELQRDKHVIYYFCSSEDGKRNNATAVLRGLLWQVIAKRPELTNHLLRYFEKPEQTEASLTSPETLWRMFTDLMHDTGLGKTYCILDGLDECDADSKSWLSTKLVDLTSQHDTASRRSSLQVTIVSRDIPDIGRSMCVKLDPDHDEHVNSDIEQVVSDRVQKLSRITGFDDYFRQAIERELLKRAQGTFLWVGFAMMELSKKKTRIEVEETVHSLPKGLPAIYSRMLRQIQPCHRKVSSLILNWVTIAVRPLSFQELAAAIGTRPSALVSVEQAIQDQLTHCGLLLQVREQKVGLVHQSARDYLLRKETDSDDVLEQFRVKLQETHLEIAQTCLDCIQRSSLRDGALDLHEAAGTPSTSHDPLLSYAVFHWPEHATGASTHIGQLLEHSSTFFHKKSRIRANWWQTYSVGDWPPNPPRLHMACYSGVIPWAEVLLDEKLWKPRFYKSANKSDSMGNQPSLYAASRGHEAIVLLLLSNGADANQKSKYGHTILQRAAISGQEAVVQLLLDRGADVSTKGRYGDTALHHAAYSGHEAIVQLLLDRGADVSTKSSFGNTALHDAAYSGHEAIVQLLLDYGADVSMKGSYGGTALHSAASSGHEAIVQLLLDRGADVKMKDYYGRTALYDAASSGHKAIVQLLRDHGAV